jgi:pyrophosphatase PpaX
MKLNGTLRAVLLDLDGTILDSQAQDEEMIRRLMADVLGQEPDEARVRELFGVSSRNILEALAPDRVDELLPAMLDIQKSLDGMSRVFLEIPPVLRTLARAGMSLGVVTSQSRAELAESQRTHSLPSEIEVWVTADDAAKPKPDPQPVLYALDLLGISPGQAIMVGDTRFDMQAGKAAGTLVGAALWGTNHTEELLRQSPDLVFQSPLEMEKLLRWKRN